MSRITTAQYLGILTRLQPKREQQDTTEPQLGTVEREADLHDQVAEYCHSRGWIPFHGSMAHPTKRVEGEPDFIVARDDGKTVYAELKRRNGKPTPAQQAMLHWLERNKQICGVVRSLSEFIALAGRKE